MGTFCERETECQKQSPVLSGHLHPSLSESKAATPNCAPYVTCQGVVPTEIQILAPRYRVWIWDGGLHAVGPCALGHVMVGAITGPWAKAWMFLKAPAPSEEEDVLSCFCFPLGNPVVHSAPPPLGRALSEVHLEGGKAKLLGFPKVPGST